MIEVNSTGSRGLSVVQADFPRVSPGQGNQSWLVKGCPDKSPPSRMKRLRLGQLPSVYWLRSRTTCISAVRNVLFPPARYVNPSKVLQNFPKIPLLAAVKAPISCLAGHPTRGDVREVVLLALVDDSVLVVGTAGVEL